MLSILILAALFTLHGNSASGKALFFGGTYAVLLGIIGFMSLGAGGSLTTLLVLTAIRFGAATLLFWLMDRFHGLLGWVLAILGALILSFAL